MHKIYWGSDQISMLTNSIDSVAHKHWMLQLFLSTGNPLQLSIEGQEVSGICFLVSTNCTHSFVTGEQTHFSMLIESTSDLALQFQNIYLKEKSFCDLSDYITFELTKLLIQFCNTPDQSVYTQFLNALLDTLHLQKKCSSNYDDRINKLFQLLTTCESTDLTVPYLASQVYLSPSRLAHLFKEQTGVPLKSYLVLHKMYQAFSLLLHGSSITDAAITAGFDSPSHFAATTKAFMGTSPRLAIKDSDFLKVSD